MKGSSPSTAAFSGGLPSLLSPSSVPLTTNININTNNNQPPQQHYQLPQQHTPQYPSSLSSGPLSPPERLNAPGSPRGWAHVDTSTPVHSGYTARPYSNQQQSQFKEDTSYATEAQVNTHTKKIKIRSTLFDFCLIFANLIFLFDFFSFVFC